MSTSDDQTDADLWLLNSCTVKSPAEDHFRNEIKHARDLDKFIVIAGCVPQGQPKADYMQVIRSYILATWKNLNAKPSQGLFYAGTVCPSSSEKKMFLLIFYLHSSIVLAFSIATYPVC